MPSHRATLILATLGSAALHASVNWGLARTTGPLWPPHVQQAATQAAQQSVIIRQLRAPNPPQLTIEPLKQAPQEKMAPAGERQANLPAQADIAASPTDIAMPTEYWPSILLDTPPTPQAEIALPPPEGDVPPEGHAVLELFINAHGQVDRIVVKESNAPADFVENAKAIFQGATFAPGIKDALSVPSRIIIDVRYETP